MTHYGDVSTPHKRARMKEIIIYIAEVKGLNKGFSAPFFNQFLGGFEEMPDSEIDKIYDYIYTRR